MELDELQSFLARELSYPVTVADVRDEVGDAVIEAPDAEDDKTLDDLLADVEDDEYDSVRELTEAVRSRLPDEYIGRKHYDDRGPNVEETEEAEAVEDGTDSL